MLRARGVLFRSAIQKTQSLRYLCVPLPNVESHPTFSISTKKDVTNLSEADIHAMDIHELETLIFHTSMKKFRLSHTQLRYVAIGLCQAKEPLSALSVGNFVYGLRPYNSSTMDLSLLLSAIAEKVTSCQQELRAQHVGNAMYGMHGMCSTNADVRKLIRALSAKFATCSEDFNAQEIANCLYGLRSLRSSDREVRELLQVLTTKISSCTEPLRSQAIGVSLFGMRNLLSYHQEVRSLVKVVAEKIENSGDVVLDAKAVGSGLHGLQNMKSDSFEVRLLIKALIPKIENSWDVFDSRSIGTALLGLKLMKSEHEEVRELIRVLCDKVENRCVSVDDPKVQLPLSGTCLASCLAGIQSMSSDHAEVRRFIAVISERLQTCEDDFKALDVVNAAAGLRGKSAEHAEVRNLVSALARKFRTFNGTIASKEDSRLVFRNICDVTQSTHPEVRELLSALLPIISSMSDNVHDHDASSILSCLNSRLLEYPEAQTILSMVSDSMKYYKGCMDFKTIMTVVSGFRNISADSQHTRDILRLFRERYEVSENGPRQILVEKVNSTLEGFYSMNNSTPEVRDVLSIVADGVEMLTPPIEPASIAPGLSCLGQMKFSSTEKLDDPCTEPLFRLLQSVCEKLNKSSTATPVHLHTVAEVLYGLQGLLTSPASQGTFDDSVISPGLRIARIYMDLIMPDVTGERGWISRRNYGVHTTFTIQYLTLFLHATLSVNSAETLNPVFQSLVEDVKAAIVRFRSCLPKKYKMNSIPVSPTAHQYRLPPLECVNSEISEAVTEEVRKHVERLGDNSGITIEPEFNIYLDCFPADIVISYTKENTDGSKDVVLRNFQIITEKEINPGDQYRHALRDSYLTETFDRKLVISRVLAMNGKTSAIESLKNEIAVFIESME